MTAAPLSESQNQLEDDGSRVSPATTITIFIAIILLSILLRIVYASHLYEDDGLWFTAGEELLRGKALYREIYFDKPPGIALIYAFLFSLFGTHVMVIRLFTIAYAISIAFTLYSFGRFLYGQRIALLAALMFSVFSTTYVTGHVQSLSTDLLMALPYTASAYYAVRAIGKAATRKRVLVLAIIAGVWGGVAFQINPKGVLSIIFVFVLLIVFRAPGVDTTEQSDSNFDSRLRSPALILLATTAGFLIGAAPFLMYVALTGSLKPYWQYVWIWGAKYGSYYGAGHILITALTRTIDYLSLNNTLLIGLVITIACFARPRSKGRDVKLKSGSGQNNGDARHHWADLVLLIWLAVSYAGVMIGGRFFGHYFIQILPVLCLLGARGLIRLDAPARKNRLLHVGAIVLVIVGFAYTMVRFHGRGLMLALDSIRGHVSETNAAWYYNQRAHEERTIAAVVRDFPDPADEADKPGLERFRASGETAIEPEGANDYLFVWGYRPEIYFWSGLLPASRFLSSQQLTGVPADVHYFGDDYHSVLDESVAREARAQLLEDLEQTEPKYIIDELGYRNNDLGILRYPELREFLSGYKPMGATGQFFVYVRNDMRKKYQRRHGSEER